MLIGYGALLWLCLFAATRSGELRCDIHVGKPHLTGKAPLACEEVAMADWGQAFFSMRFLVQWIASEKRKESVIPLSFWFFSIGGGLTLFTYALHRLDPVFILGEGAGIFICSRNLYLIWRKQQAGARIAS